jgi:hypothetical protein
MLRLPRATYREFFSCCRSPAFLLASDGPHVSTSFRAAGPQEGLAPGVQGAG